MKKKGLWGKKTHTHTRILMKEEKKDETKQVKGYDTRQETKACVVKRKKWTQTRG